MTDQRKPWEDRFRVPTMSELRTDFPDAPEAPKYWDRMVEFLDGIGLPIRSPMVWSNLAVVSRLDGRWSSLPQ